MIFHEILQGRQKEGTKTALLLVGFAQRILFEKMGKETLDDILRIGRRVAATSNKSVERWPVGFAENGERSLRGFIGAGVSGLQHDSPLRRLKGRGPSVWRSGSGFQ